MSAFILAITRRCTTMKHLPSTIKKSNLLVFKSTPSAAITSLTHPHRTSVAAFVSMSQPIKPRATSRPQSTYFMSIQPIQLQLRSIHTPSNMDQQVETVLKSFQQSLEQDSTTSSSPTHFSATGSHLRFHVLPLSTKDVQLLDDRIDGEIQQWVKRQYYHRGAISTASTTTFEAELPNSALLKRLLAYYFNHSPRSCPLIDEFAQETKLTDEDLTGFVKAQKGLSAEAETVAKLVELQFKIREVELEFESSLNRSNSIPSTHARASLFILRQRAATLHKIGLKYAQQPDYLKAALYMLGLYTFCILIHDWYESNQASLRSHHNKFMNSIPTQPTTLVIDHTMMLVKRVRTLFSSLLLCITHFIQSFTR